MPGPADRSVTRQQFLAGAGLTTAGLASWPIPNHQPTALGRKDDPNILVIMSDEHDPAVTGCYGNSLVETPNLDRLARDGITFDNCYTNSPICVPSRLSFTAGQYASKVGAWNNDCRLSDAYTTLPEVVNSSGYESFLIGKMHYDSDRRYGFREIGEAWTNQYDKQGTGGRRPPYSTHNRTESWRRRADDFDTADESRVLAHDRGVTERAVNFLNDRSRQENPFFLLCGYLAPHFPLTVPEEYYRTYSGKTSLPELPPGHLEAQTRNYHQLRRGFGVLDTDPEVVQKGRDLYYGLTTWMDNEVGKVLRALENSEVAENTVVIYTSDHGEMAGEHGLWWKNCMYEQAAKVPLVVSWPERWGGGQRRRRVCSLVDVARTICELSGATNPETWDGDSLLPWLDDGTYQWKDYALSEYYAHNTASGFVMYREGKYKYVYHTPPRGYDYPAERELYDLESDPREFVNLANVPEYRDRIERMHERLVQEVGEKPARTEERSVKELARGYLSRDEQGR